MKEKKKELVDIKKKKIINIQLYIKDICEVYVMCFVYQGLYYLRVDPKSHAYEVPDYH